MRIPTPGSPGADPRSVSAGRQRAPCGRRRAGLAAAPGRRIRGTAWRCGASRASPTIGFTTSGSSAIGTGRSSRSSPDPRLPGARRISDPSTGHRHPTPSPSLTRRRKEGRQCPRSIPISGSNPRPKRPWHSTPRFSRIPKSSARRSARSRAVGRIEFELAGQPIVALNAHRTRPLQRGVLPSGRDRRPGRDRLLLGGAHGRRRQGTALRLADRQVRHLLAGHADDPAAR